MKISEFIQAKLEKFSIELTDVELSALLIDQGIGEDDEYVSGSDVVAKKALISIIPDMLTIASESEGGYSKTYNIEGIKAYYAMLCKEAGVEDKINTTPKVTDQSDRW